MKFFVASLVSALALSANLAAAAGHPDGVHRARGHVNVIKHFLGSGREAAANQTQLAKRFDGAHFTYYAAGLGACGQTNSASDFIVAMNSPQFAGGSQCFKTITITINGKSTQASVVDECPGCPYGGLDFSQGLFEFFAPTSVGVLTGSWVFGSGEQPTTTKPSPTPTPTPTPTSTWSPEPTPTSTWSPPPSSSAAPTSTWSPPPSSSSSSSSASSSSSSSSSHWKESTTTTTTTAAASSTDAPAASASAEPSSAAAPASTPSSRLEEMNSIIMAFANLAVAAAQ